VRALVTGGGGFLGKAIVERLLARGDEVASYSRKRYAALDSIGVESMEGDLRDRETVVGACANRDIVFHVAALPGIWGRWDDYYETNTLGTRYLLEGCRRGGVRKLVYTSSPSVTFGGKPQSGVDEREPYPRRWLAHYPHSKALAEQEVLRASDDELLTCALRPHLIWGPDDPHLIPRLLERARKGELVQVGSGTNLIDTTYVDNGADAHILAADALAAGSPVAAQAYFLSDAEPVGCWQWIGELLALAGLPPLRRRISFPLAWGAGQLLEWKHRLLKDPREPRMTRFLAAQLALDHWFDVSKARRDFGYVPTVSRAEGMRRLAESWKTNPPAFGR
jgi:nucleoside-diphosphate-sugar epimerase